MSYKEASRANVAGDPFEVYKLNIIEILAAGSGEAPWQWAMSYLRAVLSDFLLNVDLFMEYSMRRVLRRRAAGGWADVKNSNQPRCARRRRKILRATSRIIRELLPNQKTQSIILSINFSESIDI